MALYGDMKSHSTSRTVQKRDIFWGDCYEVQEIRNDELEPSFFPYKFDADEANKVCEVCKWYIAD